MQMEVTTTHEIVSFTIHGMLFFLDAFLRSAADSEGLGPLAQGPPWAPGDPTEPRLGPRGPHHETSVDQKNLIERVFLIDRSLG